jgi:nucleoside-diphosphate-sugar epimerase
MKETILVTGAEGFIGMHLVTALTKFGYAVERHSHRDGDIANCNLLYSTVSHVFHLAAKTFVPESWRETRAFYETNVLGTINVLEFCRRRHASLTLISSYVYGAPRQLPVTEEHPLQAFNPYASSKVLAEEAARYYSEQFCIPVTIVRPFNIYGPGQAAHFLIPSLIRQVMSPECDHIRILDERPRRDYLFVDDFVMLLMALLDHRASDTYNAGFGRSVGVSELIDTIQRLAPSQKPVSCLGSERPEEILDVVADVQKVWRKLRWKPSTTLEAGLRRIIETFTIAYSGSTALR